MTTTTQQPTETAAAAQSATGPDTLTVVAWRDPLVERMPGAIPTASDDALVTGRAGVFEPGECRRVTRRVGQ